MPLIQGDFKPANRLFCNAHVNTIYANLLRFIPKVNFKRERIKTPDSDFLDLDFFGSDTNKNLIIVLAGLEGKSTSHYTRSLVRFFTPKHWDVCAMNYRGCSGEPNNLLQGYHMGKSEDLKTTIEFVTKNYNYKNIILVGYSLGGNICLKYLGEEHLDLPPEIKGSINFSTPMDLAKSAIRLEKWYNWHFLKWFMIQLNHKIFLKKRQFKGVLKNYKAIFMAGTFRYFDKHFTAPVNGFDSVEDYWMKASCLPILQHIKTPSLIVYSDDDTFLTDRCKPIEISKNHSFLYLEQHKFGGHCGFISNAREKESWMEKRVHSFIRESCGLD